MPKRFRRAKFDDCRDCQHIGTYPCASCTIGENFEERALDDLDLSDSPHFEETNDDE